MRKSRALTGGITPTGTLGLAVATAFWPAWARIAVERRQEAWAARERLAAAYEAGDKWDANEEFDASLVSIAAAAFCIDGIYGVTCDLIPVDEATRVAWANNGTARHRRISETLRRGFVLGSKTNAWPAELEWLFDLRDGNVHPELRFRDADQHPVIGNASADRVAYSPESTDRAVGLMFEVLEVVAVDARPQRRELRAFVDNNRGVLEQTLALRD